MIKFFADTTLYIVEEFDEKSDTVTKDCHETFKAGDLVQADIVDDSENAGYVDLQFGDGSMTYHVLRGSFEVVA
jgi:exosome complex RNA-binding protein Rrp4